MTSDDEIQKGSDLTGEPGFDDDSFNEDFEGGSKGATSLRENPLFKVGIVVGGLAAVVAGLILFGGKEDPVAPSTVSEAPELTSTPGTDAVPPSYADAVKQTNVEGVEQAQRTGGSALPVPIAPPVGRVMDSDDNGNEAEDPLARWRRIQEERERRNAKQKKELPGANQTDPTAEAINKLSQAMNEQMQSILERQSLKEMQQAKVVDEETFFNDIKEKRKKAEEEAREEAAALMQAAAPGTTTPADLGEEPIDILIPAATIEYAQLLLEANSDIPGPVMAQIMSGPLAGSRILGSFSTQDEYLTLNFNSVIVDGISHPISAVAIDPDTTLPGMATEIDKRYFSRVILPAAAAFIEGLGSAIAQSGSTTINTGIGGAAVSQTNEDLDFEQEVFRGVEEASSKVSEIIDRDAGQIKPLVRVAAGTPMGILFTQPVTEETRNR
jgi:intracellular multiplication protein IcmE